MKRKKDYRSSPKTKKLTLRMGAVLVNERYAAHVRSLNRIGEALSKEVAALQSDADVSKFLLTFFACEATARVVIGAAKDEDPSKALRSGKVPHPPRINSALKQLQITMPTGRVDQIFKASEMRRNSCSCVRLRNQIAHQLSEPDIREVRRRCDSLCIAMIEFMSVIKKVILAGRFGTPPSPATPNGNDG
jgi:hypothetical protein